MHSSSGGSSVGASGLKRAQSLFSPEKASIYPHKRSSAPSTPAAPGIPSAALQQPPAVGPASGNESPRTRSSAYLEGSRTPRAAFHTPTRPHHAAAAASAFAATKSPQFHSSNVPSQASAQSEAPTKQIPSTPNLVVSLRRSPRLKSPSRTDSCAVVLKRIGNTHDVRQARILNLVVRLA